ncbi:folate-binding protein YgfZ [Microbulbifer sp. 2205BS26-8]|uniref:CAF17-like 4Fe-4S cluster assembly/insertion protein YgfZ n=1 Tax=Microbulbifer sp. 2205BS26-8 TaxID=3064386 RepID=UPI00273DBA61|nr:folate-binding protein [Microbulbifer sp. 2205BS26-8]MDP5210597.1 folate-binding protein [Microbulbifer sp. 2205BS26-8]
MDRQQWQDFLSGQGAIWEGEKAHFPLTSSDDPQGLHLIDLSPIGSISIHGPDSQKFLQGQITCDLVNLPDGHSTLGAHCNPKGRIISTFSALKVSPSRFIFRLLRDLGPIAQQALAKYAVFFNTQLQDISEKSLWLGLQGQDAAERAAQLLGYSAPATGAVVAFDFAGERCIAQSVNECQLALLVPVTKAQQLWQTLAPLCEVTGYDLWQKGQIDAGIPQINAATSGMFIPQMTNLHLLGGVSFKKGCYTGQEVVARMQYRGATKRRLYRAKCTGGDLPASGLEIYGEGKQSIGNLVEACHSQDGIQLLAVLTIAKVAAGETLRLKDGRILEIQELPYDADADPLA